MIRVSTFLQRLRSDSKAGWCLSLPTNFLTGSSPSLIPAQECSVTPPMLIAAIPVEAVIATVSGISEEPFVKNLIISLNRTDFPVPTTFKIGNEPHR